MTLQITLFLFLEKSLPLEYLIYKALIILITFIYLEK